MFFMIQYNIIFMLKCKFNATQVMIIDTRQGSSVYVAFGQKQIFEQIPPPT